MLTLPMPPRVAWLKAFWLVMSAVAGLFVGISAALAGCPVSLVAGSAGAVGLAVPGLVWPEMATLPYRYWNRIARVLAKWAISWLTFVCYRIVFFAVSRAGTGLRLARPVAGESMWIKRTRTEPGAVERNPCEHWVKTFLTWTRETGSWWAIGLLPFLLLIAMLDVEREESFPIGIYTLF